MVLSKAKPRKRFQSIFFLPVQKDPPSPSFREAFPNSRLNAEKLKQLNSIRRTKYGSRHKRNPF